MISIIIPTFNSGNYISQAIESILNQSYKNYEIIVVDDGSTDSTYKELKKYKSQIKYYYKGNGGVASARNFGILKSKGEYICFLDADDLYKKGKLEAQVKFLEDNPHIDIVYNDVEVADENLNYINTLKSEGIYPKREDFLSMMLLRQVIPGPASIMLRRKCIEAGLFYNDIYKNAEDYDFTLRLAQRFKYGYIPESLYVYRRHNYNLTNNHKLQLNNEIEIVNKLGIEYIKNVLKGSSFSEEDRKLILSKILIKISEWKEARHILLDILKTKENGLIDFYLGNCYYHFSDYYNAREHYKDSLLLDSTLAETHNNLGCTNIKLGRLDEAKLEFSRALELRKEYIDAKINLESVNKGKFNCKITEKELRKNLTAYR